MSTSNPLNHFFSQANGDTSRDLRLDSDDIVDPINDRLTAAEKNERLQGQLMSLKNELAVTQGRIV